MVRVRLDQPINANGIDTTAAALLDSGRAIVQQWDNFGRNNVTKYVLVLLDAGGAQTDDYFEIGAKAYQSRAAKGQDRIQEQIAPEAPTGVLAGNAAAFRIDGGAEYRGVWDRELQCYVVTVNESALALLRDAFEVHEAAPNVGPYCLVSYSAKPPPVRRVYIPTRAEHEGLYGAYVKLVWLCPQCGMERGEPESGISYDGSRRLHVDTWVNSCGHVDAYKEVRKEAAANGLNTHRPTSSE